MGGEYAVGIDVGGTKIAGVLIDGKGVVRKRKRIPTQAEEGGQAVLGRISLLIRKLTRRKDLKVGISFPGYIDEEGLLRSCPNIPDLEGKPLRQLLHRHVQYPLTIENDANCFALAEQRGGAAVGKQHVFGLIIGTGIGGGMVINGEPYRGAHGAACEVGHLPYGEEDIEAYASGPGILKRYFLHGGKEEKAERIFDKRTLVARKTVRETVDALAWLCAVIHKAYDPEVVVLGGGVSNAPILKDLQKQLKEEGISLKIIRNALGDDAGMLGAAFLTQEKV